LICKAFRNQHHQIIVYNPDSVVLSCTSRFNSLIKEINLIISELSNAEKVLSKLRNDLNGFFALRLFSWCANYDIECSREQLYAHISRIIRKPGNFFDIYLKDKNPLPLNKQNECSQVLGEKIAFH
jgi:hypothetical protein